jgi:Ras-related protein Rab-1A
MSNDECIYKTLILGDTTVGKTCFLLKYTDKTFQEAHLATIGLDYRLKTMKLKNGKEIKLQIWDTAGQDRFRAITRNYYKGSHGILLLYDVTNVKSFENIKTWVSSIREEASKDVVVYIVGNKIDNAKNRKVETEEGKELAEELGFPFMETSAKNNINVSETFEDLVERIDKIYGNIEQKPAKIYKAKNKSKCCS